MNAFIGISKAQATNLAVVVTIPAVLIYNAFARAIGGYRALVGDATAEVRR